MMYIVFFEALNIKRSLVTLNRCDCSGCFLSEITATVQLSGKGIFLVSNISKGHVLKNKRAGQDLGSIGGGCKSILKW